MYVYIDEVACSITWPVTLWGSVHMLVLHQVSGERDRNLGYAFDQDMVLMSGPVACSCGISGNYSPKHLSVPSGFQQHKVCNAFAQDLEMVILLMAFDFITRE